MSKYLDYSGLNTLWDRIKSYVASSISSSKADIMAILGNINHVLEIVNYGEDLNSD